MAVLSVPIAKAGNATLDVDVDALPQEVFAAVVMEGLKAVLGKKMSKITGLTKLEGEELTKAHEAAMVIAKKNLDDMNSGKVPGGRSTKKSGVPAAVMTEARRLAKAVVKDQIRAAGMKISHVAAKDITEAANQLIAQDPSYVEQAKTNLENRATMPVQIDIKSLVHESPTLVAKAEQKKAAAKANAPLSAKQAGKVAPRKGTAPTAHA